MQPRGVDPERLPPAAAAAAPALVRGRGEPEVLLDDARGDADDVVAFPVLDEPGLVVGVWRKERERGGRRRGGGEREREKGGTEGEFLKVFLPSTSTTTAVKKKKKVKKTPKKKERRNKKSTRTRGFPAS